MSLFRNSRIDVEKARKLQFSNITVEIRMHHHDHLSELADGNYMLAFVSFCRFGAASFRLGIRFWRGAQLGPDRPAQELPRFQARGHHRYVQARQRV